jgi:transposase
VIEDASRSTSEALLARVAELEAALASERARADDAIAERDRLREGYRHLQLEVEVARRRLVITKAERIDTQQLELEFAAKLRELDVLAGRLPGASESESDDDAAPRG